MIPLHFFLPGLIVHEWCVKAPGEPGLGEGGRGHLGPVVVARVTVPGQARRIVGKGLHQAVKLTAEAAFAEV